MCLAEQGHAAQHWSPGRRPPLEQGEEQACRLPQSPVPTGPGMLSLPPRDLASKGEETRAGFLRALFLKSQPQTLQFRSI